MGINLSLVLPFYNEEENVQWVCEELMRTFNAHSLKYELIAVDNGSWDKTVQIVPDLAKQYPDIIKPCRVEVNQGYGYGILQGLKQVSGEYVGYSPGDGQVPAEDILRVYLKAKELELDFVQGQRLRKDSGIRRMNTLTFNTIFHLFFGCPVRDVGSNPKIFKRKWLEKMNLRSKDWFIDSEVILKIHHYGGKMQEFPVAFRKREMGKSKINVLSALEMLKNMLIWKYRILLENKASEGAS